MGNFFGVLAAVCVANLLYDLAVWLIEMGRK